APGGSELSQRQASALCRWPPTDNASHTFRSGKNEVMGVLVFGEGAAQLARARNQGACHVLAFLGLTVSLLDGPDNQGTDRGAGPLRPETEPVMQRVGDINGGSDCHDIIMS